MIILLVDISYVVAVLTLWLKKVKVCLADIWKMTSKRLLPDNSNLQEQLIHIVWTNAESPVSQLTLLYYHTSK